MNASVHFSTPSTRRKRASSNSDGLASVMSSPGRYSAASSSVTSRSGSSARRRSRSSRMARSARKSEGPLTSTTGAGRGRFQSTCGMTDLTGAFAAGVLVATRASLTARHRPSPSALGPDRDPAVGGRDQEHALLIGAERRGAGAGEDAEQPCRSDARSRCPRPTPISPTAASSRAYSAALWSAEPWWRPSRRRPAPGGRPPTIDRCASSPRSPSRTADSADASQRFERDRDARLVPGSARASGQSTRQRHCPKTSCVAEPSAGRPRRRPSASAATSRSSSGPADGPTSTRSTRPVDRADAPDVVEVEVGEHEQVDPADAELAEALGQRLRIRAGVDEHDEPVAACRGSRRPARRRTSRTASLPGGRCSTPTRTPTPPAIASDQARPRPAEARSGPARPSADQQEHAERRRRPGQAGHRQRRRRTRRPRRSTPPAATRRARPGLRRGGATTASAHTTSPSTVASGAAGPASRFASTP